MADSYSGAKIAVHGGDWLVCDLREEVDWCREQSGWELRQWRKRDALADKHHSSPYAGQQLRTPAQRVVPGGWDHDDCTICYWKLEESSDEDVGWGYTYDGSNWVCVECFSQFVGVTVPAYDV